MRSFFKHNYLPHGIYLFPNTLELSMIQWLAQLFDQLLIFVMKIDLTSDTVSLSRLSLWDLFRLMCIVLHQRTINQFRDSEDNFLDREMDIWSKEPLKCASHTQPCTAMHSHAQLFTTMHSHAQPCTTMHSHAQPCTAMHSLARLCTAMQTCTAVHSHSQLIRAMHSHAQPFTAMHRDAQPCTAMRRYAQPCTAMHSHAQPCTAIHTMA